LQRICEKLGQALGCPVFGQECLKVEIGIGFSTYLHFRVPQMKPSCFRAYFWPCDRSIHQIDTGSYQDEREQERARNGLMQERSPRYYPKKWREKGE